MSRGALRYLVRTRLRNRVRSWLARLRTTSGLLGLLVLILVVVGVFVGVGWGRGLPGEEREAVFVTMLGFLLVTGVLSGLGQRGLVFSPADLDFLFPAPIGRPQLIAYHFVPHYIGAAFMAAMFVLVLGGRFLPHPALFLLGVFLCQATTSHLSAAAAELSMKLADNVFRRMRVVVIVLVVAMMLTAMFLLVAGLGGWGDVPARLREGLSSDLLRVLLFPARQAVTLGAHPDLGGVLAALGSLLACAALSFGLVLLVPVDVVTGSFESSRRAHARVEQWRRGMRPARAGRSVRPPRSALLHGAGAVLWLNWMTLKRQLRATLGGLFVVLVIFVVVGARGAGRHEATLGKTLLSLLAMIPLWMPLPIGFRLPREQLAELRALPLRPLRLAAALLVVPVLAPFVLQTAGVGVLTAAGRLAPATALAALPLLFVSGSTLLTVEAMFVLRRPHPNAVNLLLSMAQLLVQLLALLPGLFVVIAVQVASGSTAPALLAATLCQAAVSGLLLASLGRQFQERDLEGALS